MRTLSEVFAPRGPLLPEGLRTLEVSPNRVIEPGSTVHAAAPRAVSGYAFDYPRG